jgi:UDPglucose 6-dehydrogenase
MKIQIVGYGFVGQAHALALGGNNDIHIYDPVKGYEDLIDNPDAIIICVSTPQDDNGRCNMRNVYGTILKCPKNVPILIKSTISLEGWRSIKSLDKNNMISFSPEFLRAQHAYEDFKNQEVIYIGGGNEIFWASRLSTSLKVKVECKNPEALILAKYYRNSFLATKVAFFNQIFDLCETTEVDFDTVRELVIEDKRIGESHSYVTKERGFGGHCFPKDTSAITWTSDFYGYDSSIIKSAIEYNDRIKK